MLSTKKYNYLSWNEKYPNNQVSIKTLYLHSDWNDLFDKVFIDNRFKRIEDYLSTCLRATEGKVKMYPYPDFVFAALNVTPLSKIKVVILGQDPYHKNEIYNDKVIPQAMGLSFSVPVGIKVPTSLKNIYNNLLKYKHMTYIPNHGNLEFWTQQGVLMLNTALTVQHGHPNSHEKYWTWLTNDMIKYISTELDNVVFMLWGKSAYSKVGLIDVDKHKILASSHPSGLSFSKKMGNKPAFKEFDHFGETNKYLKENGEDEILWQISDST